MPLLAKKHGTTVPDSTWTNLDSTHSRKLRRILARTKPKEEHGMLPREVKRKATKATKTSKKNKGNGRGDDLEHEPKIGKEDKQGDVRVDDMESQTKGGKEDGQESVEEEYNENAKDDSTEDKGVGEDFTENYEGIEENVSGNEGVEEDVTEEHDKVANEEDNEDRTKKADSACESAPLTQHHTPYLRAGTMMVPSFVKGWPHVLLSDKHVEEDVTPRQRVRAMVIPSLVVGWPPVLLSESIFDQLDPIDFKIMQLECRYHLADADVTGIRSARFV
ncbi:hypothetical protein DFH29DRAFT_399806 [Suillus ampliporus]|nr:hypothetical protein DFH29DRAFT_399806 [Suillus ampliporus]